MALLSDNFTVVIDCNGEDVIFVLRQPTNEELNKFFSARYSTRRNKLKDASYEARAKFFDKLLVKVENLEDAAGAITPERKDAIPLNWKHGIIFNKFEDDDINVKN